MWFCVTKMSCDKLSINRFGFGSGIHAMDDANCTGEEPHILSCSYSTLGGAHNCAIFESVGVQCSEYIQAYLSTINFVYIQVETKYKYIILAIVCFHGMMLS